MKKLILTTALGLASVTGVLGQATLNFSSIMFGGAFWTTNAAGVLASGGTYMADLWYGPQGSTESSLVELGLPSTFATGALRGLFTGGARTIPGYAGGTTITAQVRVWNATQGTYYTSVENGKSILFTVTLATHPETPANMTGLIGQNITMVPEPTGMSLVAMGLVTAHVFRRRRRL